MLDFRTIMVCIFSWPAGMNADGETVSLHVFFFNKLPEEL